MTNRSLMIFQAADISPRFSHHIFPTLSGVTVMLTRFTVLICLFFGWLSCSLLDQSCYGGLMAQFQPREVYVYPGETAKPRFTLTNSGPGAVPASDIVPMTSKLTQNPSNLPITLGAVTLDSLTDPFNMGFTTGRHSVTVGSMTTIPSTQKSLATIDVFVASDGSTSVGGYQLVVPTGTIGIDITGGTAVVPPTSVSLGYTIQVTTPFYAVGLGVFDQDGDGVELHDVGLWSNTGPTLLASVQVGPLSQAYASRSIPDVWRYVRFANSIYLQPGFYTIAAHYAAGQTDAVRTNGTSIFSGSGDLTFYKDLGIEIIDWKKKEGASLEFPDVILPPDQRFAGPTIFGATPEPSSFLLAFVAGIGGWYMKRRRAI